MWIKELELKNFRNIEDGSYPFQKGLNWLYGANGQGKTNLLESAYFSLTGKSFRTSNLRELQRDSAAETSLKSTVSKGLTSWQYGVRFEKGKTVRFLGGKPCKSLDFFKSTSVIAFTSRSKSLVDGSPDDRRRFLDRMISCTEPEFMVQLGKYRKIHGQLRSLLMSRGNLGVYRGFKSLLAPIGRSIVEKRKSFLEFIRDEATSVFREVFQGEGTLQLAYRVRSGNGTTFSTMDDYEHRLVDISAQELLYGKSLMGPHLDDLQITLEDHQARRFASAGQVRAIVLATKLAVREAYFRRFGSYPVLLLDDIDAELDPTRLKGLLSFLKERGQVLISTSKYDTMEPYLEGCIYMLNAGRVSLSRKG